MAFVAETSLNPTSPGRSPHILPPNIFTQLLKEYADICDRGASLTPTRWGDSPGTSLIDLIDRLTKLVMSLVAYIRELDAIGCKVKMESIF